MAAVQGDADSSDAGDPDLFVWDLTSSGSTPQLESDPTTGTQLIGSSPEGMGVVAVEPRPNGQADLVAVGQEGSSSGANANNVYVFSRKQGTNTAMQYDGDRSAPSGAVVDLAFVQDRDDLLVVHENTLSLASHEGGTEYQEAEDGRWSPPGDSEFLQAVAVGEDSDRVVVATAEGDINPTVTLRLFEAGNGDLTEIAEPWSKDQASQQATVEISDNGEYVALGAGGQNLDFFRVLENNNTDEADFEFSSPWHRSPGEVTSLALSPNGEYLVAGTDDREMHVFERTELDPLVAENAIAEPVSLPAAPEQITFANGNQTLFVEATSVMGFSERQFDPDNSIEPLWSIDQATDAGFADNAERLGTTRLSGSGEGLASAYERSFNATLEVDAPASIQPETKADLELSVRNVGSESDAYTFQVSGLNASWTVDEPDEAVELLPRGTANATLSLTPSAGQPAGPVSFEVEVVSQSAPGNPVVTSKTVDLRVPAVHAASLDVDESQRRVSAGASTSIPVTIANDGNVDERIELSVDQQANWAIRIDEQETETRSFEIDAQQRREVTVDVEAPSDVAEGSRNEITMEAVPTTGGEGQVASIPLVVNPDYGASLSLPSEPVDATPGERIPVSFTVENTGNTRDEIQLRTEVNASNPNLVWRAGLSTDSVTLDSDDSETVEVTVRVPRGAGPGSLAEVSVTATSANTGEELTSSSFTMRVPTETDDGGLSGIPVPWAAPIAALAAGAAWRRTNR